MTDTLGSLNQTPGQRIAKEYYSAPELTMKRLAGLIDAELSAQRAAPDRVAEELRGIIPSLLAWDPSLEGSESFLRLKALAGGVCSETPVMAAHAPEHTNREGRPALSSGGAAATQQLDDFISGVTLSSDNLHALLEGRKVVIPACVNG